MTTKQIINEIKSSKIIGIVRGTYGDNLTKLARSLVNGGVKLIEVTFDQADPDRLEKTAKAISQLKKEFGNELYVGAGTVLTKDQVDGAKQAGAQFIISPNANKDVITYTKELGLISIPGAMTPTEIEAAYEYGADFVKVFPAGYLGLSFVKDVRAPLNHIPLIATAGVSSNNLAEFLSNGYTASGISGYLTDKKLIASNRFDILEEHAKKLTEIVNNLEIK